MSLKGSASFKRSFRAHQRLFRIADHGANNLKSNTSFFYHSGCMSEMDEKGRTLTLEEKKKIYNNAKVKAINLKN